MIVEEVLRSAGQPLDDGTRVSMEASFGQDFSAVRVHTGGRAADSAQAVSALAYAVGPNVVFGHGQYAPRSSSGRRLLAHELAHVVQQAANRVSGASTGGGSIVADRGLEREADTLAVRAMRTTSAAVSSPSTMVMPPRGDSMQRAPRLQRQEEFPFSRTKSYPTQQADDFVPDDAFYELLAHNVSYEGGLAGTYKFVNVLDKKYLYKAKQSSKASGLGLSGFTPGMPAPVEDDFAFMASPPVVAGANAPLYYQISKLPGSDISGDKGSGLNAYYLIPSKLGERKILVFRGTEPSAADLKADVSGNGVGSTAFKDHRTDIGDILDKLRSTPGKVVVVGHSLGGVLAQRATAAFPQDVDELVTFNSPGVGTAALGEFKKKSADLAVEPKARYYVTRGDIVSTAGGSRLPGTVTMMTGNATRKLEGMLVSGRIKLAGDVLREILVDVKVLANPNVSAKTSLTFATNALLSLWISGREGVLRDLGGLIASLHSQRLLRASQIQWINFPQWPGGPVAVDEASQPVAPDVRKLSTATGSIEKKAMNAEMLSSPTSEGARMNLARMGFGDDIDRVYRGTTSLIEIVRDKPMAALAIQWTDVNLLQSLANGVWPIISRLVAAVAKAGGLEALIKAALYYEEKAPQATSVTTLGQTIRSPLSVEKPPEAAKKAVSVGSVTTFRWTP